MSILETIQIVVRIDQQESEVVLDKKINKTATTKINVYKRIIYPHSFKVNFISKGLTLLK